MDGFRDIQKTESVSKFIDGQVVRTNPFGNNRVGERAYRRSERIAAGLHLLTNHVPAHEPVRLKIRESATDLLVQMLAVRDEMRSTQSAQMHVLQGSIRELVSFVRILAVSGYVSMQNATIMIEALDDLGTYLVSSQRSMLAESAPLSKEELLDTTAAPIGRERTIRDIKDSRMVKDTSIVVDGTKVSVDVRHSEGQLTVRSQNIVDVLRTGGSLGIKDIATHLPEYSEKMIQRELAGLVTDGKIKKLGSKRWSRYELV